MSKAYLNSQIDYEDAVGNHILTSKSCTDCGDSLTRREHELGTISDGVSVHAKYEYFCARCLPKHLCVVCGEITPSAEKDSAGHVAHQDNCQMECAGCGKFHAVKQVAGSADWFCGGCPESK